jgi:hypothetical protein
MTPATKSWLQRLVMVAAVLAVLYFLRTWASAAFATGAGLLLAVLYLAAYLFLAIALPLTFITLIKFVYSVWGKAYFRAWHIRRIRNARQLREAVERGRSEQ